MGSTLELVHDHIAPRRDLAQVLGDVRELFRAVAGEVSIYAAQARSLSGRVDCYKRARDGLVAAGQIVRLGLGGSGGVPLPEEHPTTEARMKRQAHAGLRTARSVGQRYGISLDRAV